MSDTARNGYVPQVGEHVWCQGGHASRRLTGTVEHNTAGLFLKSDLGAPIVLTTSLWDVGTMSFNVLFLTPAEYSTL